MKKVEVNPLFADHVTSVAFNLTLSRTMIARLVEIATEGPSNYTYFRRLGIHGIEYGANKALRNRGLIVAPDPKWPGKYVLTEAGQHVFSLLQIAGMVGRIEDQLDKQHTKPEGVTG